MTGPTAWTGRACGRLGKVGDARKPSVAALLSSRRHRDGIGSTRTTATPPPRAMTCDPDSTHGAITKACDDMKALVARGQPLSRER
ncbi:MAG: hypothetical protein ACO3ZY_12290, partial [Phycisphaerales bacterium]